MNVFVECVAVYTDEFERKCVEMYVEDMVYRRLEFDVAVA
jgi:hypothetical protein